MLSLVRTFADSCRRHPAYYLILLALTVVTFALWQSRKDDQNKARKKIAAAHQAGSIARTHDYATYWLSVVSRWELWCGLGLMAAGPWLIGKSEPERRPSTAGRAPSRVLWVVTGAVVLGSAAANAPRLRHSFWLDEESTVRRFVVGEFSRDGEFAKPTWERTLFYYNDPNNHPLCSIVARLGHEWIGRPAPGDAFHFREVPIRFPLYLAGLAGLIALAWLAQVAGRPGAGATAVALLALHPWYVRYGVEARGYALLLPLVPVALGCLLRALQTGRFHWFLAFGMTQFLCLWAFPGVLYLLGLINLAALAWIWFGRPDERAPWTRGGLFRRLCAGNLVGALWSVLLLAPLVSPMLAYLKAGRMRGPITPAMLAEMFSGLGTGMPWGAWGDGSLALSQTVMGSPVGLAVLAALFLGALTAGWVDWWKARGPGAWVICGVLMSGPAMVALAAAQGNILYPWYVVYLLPVLLLVAGAGVVAVGRRLGQSRGAWTAATAAVCLFGAMTWRQNAELRARPIEPMRESVQAMRPVTNPFDPGVQQTLSASLTTSARLYDPFAVPLQTAEDLKNLLADADSTRRPLVVNLANLPFARQRHPEITALLEDRTLFTPDAPYRGVHGQPDRWVFRHPVATP